MLYVRNIKNVAQKRTLQGLYVTSQATPQGFVLDPNCEDEILPGTVLCISGASGSAEGDGNVIPESMYSGPAAYVTVCKGADQAPYGLSAHFAAPVFGIDEVREDGTNSIGVWVAGTDGMFRLIKPAFVMTAGEKVTAEADLAAGKNVFMAPDATGTLAICASNDPQAFIKIVNIVSADAIDIRFA